MTLTFDAMHSDEWTQRAVMGWEGELGKLAAVVAARKMRGPAHRLFRGAIDWARTRCVPGLVLAEVDYFLRKRARGDRGVMQDVVVHPTDPDKS